MDPQATLPCQLCKSGVPVRQIGNANGHSVSFLDRPAVVSLWIPCSDHDRQLSKQREETLKGTER